MAIETWYMLENGDAANPRDVAPDKTGVLRHKDGVAVEMRGEVPRSLSVDLEAEATKPKTASREMTSDDDPKRRYKTR